MKIADDELKKIKRKVALVVFPHPDDETAWAGGLIQRLLQLDWEVIVVSTTNGIRGKMHVHGKGRSMMKVRREEMNKAMNRLGVSQYFVWHYDDGTLRKKKEWKKQLRELFDHYQPGLVVSYDFSGISGHPDHITLALEVFKQAGRMKNIQLWWPSLTDELKKKLLNGSKTVEYMSSAEIEVKLSMIQVVKKYLSLKAHASQNLVKPIDWNWRYRREYFAVAELGMKYQYKYRKFKID